MSQLEIKVCGLKEPANIIEVAMLRPHYMGFILYRNSERYISPEDVAEYVKVIPQSIRKVGVIVNEPLEIAIKLARSGAFDLLQLHGNESVDYCKDLSAEIKIIKAFPIFRNLPAMLSKYQPFSSMFLFDTQGKKFGGNGEKFDHNILDNYSLKTGYLLSGGISPEDSSYIRTLKKYGMSGVDLNSRFETQPGIKNIELLKRFIENLRKDDEQY